MDPTSRSVPGGTSPRRPWPRTRSATLAVAVALAVTSGCAQPGPLTRRHTMIGALKADVAQLDSEKEQLSRELAEQKVENRRVQSELAAAEDQNGDLTARLDDARAVMSRQGLDDGGGASSTRSASESDRARPRRSNPIRSQPKRKTPFAQIPNERRSLDEDEDRPGDGEATRKPARTRDEDFSNQSRLDDRSPWLPVARDDSGRRTR